MKNVSKLNLTKSDKLFEEAKKVIPGGLMGIRNPKFYVPGEFPAYIERGYDGHLVDVDGNDYIDYLCGYGPIILGYNEKEINDAVKAQIDEGFCFSLCQETQKKLAEKLKEIIPCAEKTVFVQSGSDATSLATRIARAYTGKRKIVRVHNGFHGWHDWCANPAGGIVKELREFTVEFPYGDLNALEKLLKDGDVACVITSALYHSRYEAVLNPAAGYLEGVKKLTEKYGALLIFDEIRTGFRYALGGAQEYFGVTPDMAAVSKALGNGYPIGACVGKAEIMDSMLKNDVFVSSTFFPNSLGYVAALKLIEIFERDNVIDVVWEKGKYFAKKLEDVCAKSGLPIKFAGTPVMPYLLFDKNEPNAEKMQIELSTQAMRRKVFLAPYHHWYVAYRHTTKDLDYTVDVVAESLEIVKNKF